MNDKAPPLPAMGKHMRKLEAERERIYPLLREALEANDGCVSRAAADVWPELDPRAARDRGNRYVRRFGLVDYAAFLREAATGHAMGRQDRGSSK